ncbi:hypothetical protein ABW19_dt0206300 [Dactylella cylindrospora]|nr:hypothetical protein ABW19_dt0206300 [Dactylella cylindrospora]
MRERQLQQKEFEEQQAILRQQRRSRGSSLSSSNGSTYGYGMPTDRNGQSFESRGSYFPEQAARARPGELDKLGRRLSMQTSHSSSTSPSLHPALTPREHFEEHGWSYEPAIPTPTESVGKRMSWKKPHEEEFDLQKRLQELQLRTQTPIPLALQPGQQKRGEDREKEKVKGPRPMSLPHPPRESQSKMEYPAIPKRNPHPVLQMPNIEDFALPSKLEQYRQQPEQMPVVPPKIKDEYDPNYVPARVMAPPPRPAKERIGPTLPTPTATAPAPPQSQSQPQSQHQHQSQPQPQSTMVPPEKPKRSSYANHTFDCVAYTEGGAPLRTIFIPQGLRSAFLKIAAPNTRRNLETCGILCGFLKQNAFFVNRLVIPEQEATSDTCGMTDEAGLFNYVENEDLMVLGWIHTHPTQTCFMSSVDLHTHCPYQMMLPESIAIVCAPQSDPS